MLLAYEPPCDSEADEQLAPVDISAGDRYSNTALHLAAKKGHCIVAVTLLSKGASVRARLAALRLLLTASSLHKPVGILYQDFSSES